MNRFGKHAAIGLLDITAVVLVGAQGGLWGWLVFALGLACLGLCERPVRRRLCLLYGSIGLLGLTPISTNLGYSHFLILGLCLLLAVGGPYMISRYTYGEQMVWFRLHHGRRWTRREVAYIGLTAAVAFLLLPFMLRSSMSYPHWSVEGNASSIIRLFIGTNALGIWDELFFICCVLGILRRYLPFRAANCAQALMFASFLYELGFRGWAAFVIFGFALIQGYIFMKTESLLYVIAIHLVADFVLFLTLLELLHPGYVPIFVT